MLHLQSLTKQFGPFKALDDVDFTVNPGEIVALLGENGAGKSTLMNVVGGVMRPSAGKVLWNGGEVQLRSPRDATALGIGVVHQHFMLVPVFTVAENIALHAGGDKIYRAREWEERVSGWADSLGWTIDPARRVEELSVGERQRVEILKALFAGGAGQRAADKSEAARLLLLDEPTANLTPGETEELFEVLRRLRDGGRGIVFVSHKLNEVLTLCDRVVVLRHGKLAGERIVADTNTADLATLMVGRALEEAQAQAHTFGKTRLNFNRISHGRLHDFSLAVRAGEIAGLAGVDGNGQAELFEIVSGLATPAVGAMELLNDDGEKAPPSALTVIPPDRQHEGLILSFDLAENLALQPVLRAECRRRFAFDWAQARKRTRELMQRFDVRAPETAERSRAANLSGGNQQKMVIARALSFEPRVVVALDPTRGLDVGAAGFVHEQLRAAAREGVAVLLVSTDLDEVLALSDRIGVLYEGRLLPGAELLLRGTDRERVGALMGGEGGRPVNEVAAVVEALP